MGWLSWIIVGLIAGWLAGMIVKGGGFGILGNIIVGVIGDCWEGTLPPLSSKWVTPCRASIYPRLLSLSWVPCSCSLF